MRRVKRHKIKTEQPESSYSRDHEEHDLAFYIHDRVELMHQVFSVLKYKELKAMAPESIRNLAVGDLQELCTEELLGISSKRLLATLDGAEPPSDTESSSGSPTPDPMETISLDSISSDEEILSQASKKKKHKRHSKTKSKKREKHKPEDPAEETTEVSKASRAGLTVLELLELQARARAIRAQLQNEQAKKQAQAHETRASSDDEVEIKEEEPDVVEISSGDEKPDIATLAQAVQKPAKPKEPQNPKETVNPKEPSKPKEMSKSKELSKSKEPSKPKDTSKSKETSKAKEPQQTMEPKNTKDQVNTEKGMITRRTSDLVITVPQPKATRKIKLNRNMVTVTVPNTADNTVVETRTVMDKPEVTPLSTDKKKKQKKSKKKKNSEKEGSDHDEITLQLSDSEKMDLLEDLNEKNYERLSSSSDSESSDSEVDTVDNVLPTAEANDIEEEKDTNQCNMAASETEQREDDSKKNDMNKQDEKVQSCSEENTLSVCTTESVADKTDNNKFQESLKLREDVNCMIVEESKDNTEPTSTDHVNVLQMETESGDKENSTVIESLNDTNGNTEAEENITKNPANKTDAIMIETQEMTESNNCMEEETGVESNKIMEAQLPSVVEAEKAVEILDDDKPENTKTTPTKTQDININVTQESESESNKEKELSDGELSDRESSEVEAVNLEPEVVCISDEEKQKSSKKKKKKDKKAKKDKKSKKTKQDFRESGDQNFYKDADLLPSVDEHVATTQPAIDVTDDDDVYEILELSDDSSCYEVEGTVLSKEPTAEEIKALSAKIDEINQQDVFIEEPRLESPLVDSEQTNEESEQDTTMSWKDRYLDSKKVKRVLSTANILNALRKKNKELKRKIEQAKKDQEMEEKVVEKVLEEGSIEHYQTLPAGSQYVTVVETVENNEDAEKEKTEIDKEVTKEMKKDAKQLLKIYRKLMNSKKIKRREKKKKRKLKKRNGGDEPGESVNSANGN